MYSLFSLLLVFVIIVSLQVEVLSQGLGESSLSRFQGKAGALNQVTADEFVPDSLSRDEEDDSNDRPERALRNKRSRANGRLTVTTQVGHSQQRKDQTPVTVQRGLLKDSSPSVNVRPKTLTSSSKNPGITVESKQEGRPLPSKHRGLSTPGSASQQSIQGHMQSGAVTEEKLKTTTRKLVKWLRNRLRKRLEDVISLEEKCDVEHKILTNLNQTIENESSERRAEIRMKLQTQTEIKNVRQHFKEPELHLQQVREENERLIEELTHLKETYNELANMRKQLEDKLAANGFANWLEKRGKEYLPATAIGVLSKSAKILNPVSRGLEEAVKLDEFFSSGVESVIPVSERSLISKVIRDLALVLPLIPVIMLVWQIGRISQRLSVNHLVMYISAILAVESALMFGISLFTGIEAVIELQKSYELLLVTIVFVDLLLLISMVFLQILVTALHSSRSEMMQTLLSLVLVYHFFRAVFQSVAVSQAPTVTAVTHLVYSISFSLISFEKKAALRVGTRLDKYLNGVLLLAERWVSETWEAMKNMFVDTLPGIRDEDDGSSTDSAYTFPDQKEGKMEFDPHNEEISFNGKLDVDVEEATKALNGSLGYARWTGRRSHNRSQSKQGFRRMRSYQRNPQSQLQHSAVRTEPDT